MRFDALRFGDYYNPNFDMNFAKELLTDFNLHENKHVTKLSKGMKSALQFIILRKSISKEDICRRHSSNDVWGSRYSKRVRTTSETWSEVYHGTDRNGGSHNSCLR
ncbi:hypothetical protein J8TS2_42290 [Lederbergia ruris]|uniref:Uncharacterized protein n=1 Tax=Lederbergia ruris TaxID=217495 RepID=A0ABQ4KPP3_9BACI|nr:hypothetical protein J8TS2_42290 [Lederbergia ruris]